MKNFYFLLEIIFAIGVAINIICCILSNFPFNIVFIILTIEYFLFFILSAVKYEKYKLINKNNTL